MNLFLDFETRSACDLRTAGADVYARHTTTEVLCMGFCFDDEPVCVWQHGHPFPIPVAEHINSGGHVVAHNAPFEIAVWNHALAPRYSLPSLWPQQTICTMAMAYAMALPGSLEKAAAAVGLSHEKDMKGHRIMLQLSQPRIIEASGKITWWEDAAKLEKLIAYCAQDIEVERELYKRLMALSDEEKTVWLLDQTINQRGVAIDLKAINAAIDIVEHEKKRLDQAMREVTKGAVATCSSVGQLTDWIGWQGVELGGVAKADVTELLARPDLPPQVRRALELRREAAKSSTAKLEAMRSRVCSDGRIRGIFQYHGAATGRWAGRGIQPQNFPRPTLSVEDIESVFEVFHK